MNLMPQSYKDAFRYERMTRFVLYVGTISLIVAGTWAALLLPSYFFLSEQFKVVESTNKEASQARQLEIQTLLKEIGEVNTVLLTVKSAQASGDSVVELLREVMERSGTGIQYQNITIMRGAGGTISTSGLAATRKELQALKADMEANPKIAKVDIPVDTFNKVANISFTMTLTLK